MESILIVKFKDRIKLNCKYILGSNPYFIIDSNIKINELIEKYETLILEKNIINLSNKKLLNLHDYRTSKARIEPGAIIRENVSIADDAIILMNAVINTKASIGSRTMIDMNAVIGSGAIIKDNCHIGAGAVIAGIMEPVSNKPVIIHNNVFIGANAVILEGVEIHENSIIGAGTVITKDVNANTVVYNKQELSFKENDESTMQKTALNGDLR